MSDNNIGNINHIYMFCTLWFKYDATGSNSLFASVLHQIPKVPEGYKPEHLRLQLVRSVVVTRYSLRGIIREDLIRYGEAIDNLQKN